MKKIELTPFLKSKFIFAFLFLLALTLRLIYYLEVRNELLFQSLLFDAKYYDHWARQILTQGWLGKGIFFVSPLYAYFLAIIYKIGGSPTTVRLIQFFMGATIPLFIYGLGRRLFSQQIALIASLISCFYGPAIFFEGLLLKTSFEVFLTVLSFYLLVLAKDKEKGILWFLAGVSVGLSVLAKDTALLFVPLVLFWIYLVKDSFAQCKKASLFYLLGAVLIIGSLTIRNVVVGKDFVLTTYSSGMNFHMGNCQGADGGLKAPDFMRIDPEYEEIDSQSEAQRRAGRALKPSEISSFWFKETLKEIKQDRAHFIYLLRRKLGLLFNRTGLSDNYQMTFFEQYSFFFKYIFVGFWPIAIFGLSGIVFSFGLAKNFKAQSLLLIFFFSTAFLLILGHIIDRYREVLVPELILFSAFFLERTYQAIRKKRFLVIAISTAAIILFTLLTSIHFVNFDQMPYADAYNQLGILYREKGDLESAAKEYKNALAERPDHLWARQNLADTYLMLGKPDEAIEEYKAAIRYRPEVLSLYVLLKKATEKKGLSHEEILNRLDEEVESMRRVSELESTSVSFFIGMNLLMRKEYDQALTQFQKVIDESPNAVNALINMGIAYRQKGEPEKAIAAYQRALEVAPEIIPARYNLCMVLLSEGRFAEAIPHLEEIVNIFPEYVIAQYYLAQAYEKTDQLPKAITEYKNFISWAKDEPKNRRLVEQAKDKLWMLEEKFRQPTQGQDTFFEGAGYE